ncbi:MAG: aminoacyl-tRNA hydrolase [Caldicoprobacterales bacterium]|jgi:PTH1 family peptidyl-tRNA hydrolase
MYIITGLGNPGEKYHGTRHNIGFYVIDLLSEIHNIPLNKIKHRAVIGEGYIGDKKVVLAKPQTFMNQSGESLLLMNQWYKPKLEHNIVIYDDIDLDTGVLRIRPSGSAGSHNGMKSVIYQLHSQDFPRIRIGIGKPPEGWELSDYVLARFRDDEIEIMKKACQRAVNAVETMLSHGITDAMNKYNGHNGNG